MDQNKPILIVGAGISGLLLAQHLRETGIKFLLFERDADLTTRGVGWGLTLHWSLPALRSLLPSTLLSRLPEAYVDRAAVEEGRPSTFPFFDLSTGQLQASTPNASSDTRIRVSRDKLRRLLATGLEIHWGKAAHRFESHPDGYVTLHFDDGSIFEGSLVVACDGGSSRFRRQFFPSSSVNHIPVGLIGLKVQLSPEVIEPLRRLDPYFLQGTASENDSYVYFSVLDSPASGSNNANGASGCYRCQIVVSWPLRRGFPNSSTGIKMPENNKGRLRLVKSLATTWAEPFRSLIADIPSETDTKSLSLTDWPPPHDLRTSGNIALLGDALHPMAIYRGEGANHAIVDVSDFVELVMPHLTRDDGTQGRSLRTAISHYEDRVKARTRPAVLASRQACLDAHDWSRINSQSPLLSKRSMYVTFEE